MCKALGGGIVLFLCMTAAFSSAENPPWYQSNTFNIGQNSYTVNILSGTWRQAKRLCSALGAQLWVPEDEAEQRAVRGAVDHFYKNSLWTGINDLNASGVYRTPDENPNQELPFDSSKMENLRLDYQNSSVE